VYDAYTTSCAASREQWRCAERVYFLEREADDLRRVLIDHLNRTLITPSTRGHLRPLRAVDEIIDARSARGGAACIPGESQRGPVAMARVLEKGTLEIYDALRNLKKYPSVALEHAKAAKATENQIHHIYLQSWPNWFDNPEHKPGYMLKMREIYRHLNRSRIAATMRQTSSRTSSSRPPERATIGRLARARSLPGLWV